MAKRLRSEPQEAPSSATAPHYCRSCGGAIEVEPRRLPTARYPKRLLCRVCGTEYGTNRPVERNY